MTSESSEKPVRWWRRSKGQRKRIGTCRWATLRQKVSSLRLLLFLAVSVSLFLAMAPPSLLTPVPFVVGQTFPYDIRAPKTVRYLSKVATERRRERVAQAIPRHYRRDPSIAARWQAILQDLTESIVALQDASLPLAEKIRKVQQRVGLDLPDQLVAILLRTSPATVQYGQAVLVQALIAEWERGVKPSLDEQAMALQRVRERLDKLPLTGEVKWALKRLAETALQPNMVFDPIATEKARERARASVEPVWRTIVAGELIARKGELVTEEHLEKLQALGYNFPALLGVLLLAFALTFAAAAFTRFVTETPPTLVLPSDTRPLPLSADDRRLVLLTLLWVPGLLLVRFLLRPIGMEVAFVVVSTCAMMTAILVSPLVSLLASGIFALATSLGIAMDWQTLPMGALRPLFLSGALGMVASLLAPDVRNRMQLVRVGLLLGGVTLTLPLILGLVTGDEFPPTARDLQKFLIWAILTSAVPPALTLAGVSILERFFGITTVFTLTELAHPDTPLLRQLAEKAPGTFQSSLMVARLAQEAARRIGANDLFAWVGGLYHDIGKLARPHYFVENFAQGQENPHERLGPQLSATILAHHVQYGVELARQYGLPQPIIDLICEHHGTSLITYFWAKAKEQGVVSVDSDFRYKGPKPRSKESAILMLADSVEAAVRALPHPDPEAIEREIEEVIASKLADGQLDDAPLSLHDLQEIKRAFVETFKSIYHQRVEYPKVTVERHANGLMRIVNGGQNRQAASPQRTEPTPETRR